MTNKVLASKRSADSLVDGTTNKAYTATEKTKLAGVATGATANSSDATLLARANHTGTQSADTLTDGTTNKAFLATERTKLTGIATGATANSADATLLSRANHTGSQTADTITDGTTNKVFTATNQTKLSTIASGATANSTDAVLIARANHTGTQTASTISDFNTAVRTNRLDQMAAPTATVDLNSRLISNLLDPVSAQDASTKNYVDMTIQGLTPKPTATVVAVTALPAGTYSNGSSGVGATFTVTATGTTTVDGYVLALNDLVLLTAQASAFQNGLYTVTTAGAVGVSAVLTRHAAMNVASEISGAFVPVSNIGSTHPNSLWMANPSGAVTIGTTNIPFAEINRASDLSQGTGITISGNTVSIENSGVLLPAHGGTGAVSLTGLLKGNGASAATAATAGTDYYAPGSTDVAVTDGGTGASTASAARTNLGLVPGTDVQTQNANLSTIAGLTPTTDNFMIAASSAWASRTPAQARTSLGLVIGTNVQAWDADLDTIAGLTATTNNFLVGVSSAWASRTPAQVKTTLSLDLVDNTSDITKNLVVPNTQTASYTLVLGDASKAVEMNVASANNLTVPLNSSVAFPIGTVIEIHQYGAGQTTIVATGGVTIRSPGGKLKLTGQYSSASLRKRATDEWVAAGDLAA